MYGTAKMPLTDADYDIWGKGLRNPFRLDTDKNTGDIYIGDVGDITIEVSRCSLACAARQLAEKEWKKTERV